MSDEPTRGELIDALRELRDEIDRTPRATDLIEWGEYHHSEYERYWDDHLDALEQAGIELTAEQAAVRALREYEYVPPNDADIEPPERKEVSD